MFSIKKSDLGDNEATMMIDAGRSGAIAHGSIAERFAGVAQTVSLGSLIQTTPDCPFVDPDAIYRVVDEYDGETAEYLCIGGYPEGLGSGELIRTSATHLDRARRIAAWFHPSRDFRTADLLTWVEEHEPEATSRIDT